MPPHAHRILEVEGDSGVAGTAVARVKHPLGVEG
jgi:hypothetical protein